MASPKLLASLLAVAICAPGLAGQDPGPGPDTGPAARERVRQDVERKERLMREGRVVRSNVRIAVKLRNGARMRGIVRNGRFVERHDGLQFISADVRTRGAGVRLWYHDGTNSYIFLPFEQIQSHTIGKVLTDEEVRAIGLEVKLAEQRRKAAREAARAAAQPGAGPPGTQPPGTTPPGTTPPGTTPPGTTPPGATPPGGTPAEESDLPTLTPAQQALLDEFPPAAGWGLEKLQKLERDKIIIDRYPNKTEQRFMDNFSAWNEAYEISQEIEAAKAEAGNGSGGTPGARPGVEGPLPAPTPGSQPAGGVPAPVTAPPGTGGTTGGSPGGSGSSRTSRRRR